MNKRFVALILSLCALTACCTKGNPMQKIIKLAFLTEANALDPRFGYEIPANHLVKMLFEGLMRMTPDKVLIPAACQSVVISDDQKTYTFTLRPALWSNGETVTSHDFLYAWRSVINPQTAARGTADFYPIKNVQAVIKRELPIDAVGIHAPDERTLVVELEHPTPYFLELTSTSVFSPICASVDKKDPLWSQKMGSGFVSNGPFLLKERKMHRHLLLKKNPHYWNAEQVQVDGIHISIVETAETQLAMFERDEIDWFGKPFTKLPLDSVSDLKEHQGLTHFPEKAVYWYFLNTEKFPFNHPKIRKAFALAINRKAIVDHLLKEDEKVATSVNRGHSFFTDGNTDEALRLFHEALQELSLTVETFPSIPLSFCNLDLNTKVASIVKEQWEKTFGIQVVLEGQEWVSYYNSLVEGNYLAGGLSWHSRVHDPIYNLYLFKYKEDRLNISRWENAQYKTLLEDAEEQVDPSLRKAILTQAEQLLIDEMPVIPIYFLSVSYVKNKQLENVYVSDINEIDFASARKIVGFVD